MPIAETHRNLDDLVSAVALECGKLGGAMMVPWRVEPSQDYLQKSLEQCGCAISPDEPEDDAPLL
jgi:hypothetical protein